MAVIPDKETFYRLWRSGRLGNRLRSWTYDEFAKTGHAEAANAGLALGLRYREPGSRFSAMHLRAATALLQLHEWVRHQGADKHKFSIDEMAPHDLQTIEGEVMAPGFELTYTFVKKPMRLAFAEQQLYASGYKAKALLVCYMTDSDFSDLMELFDQYPEAVVEFSCFRKNVGMVPHRNTIFWECRNY